jgi:hypothetical protein
LPVLVKRNHAMLLASDRYRRDIGEAACIRNC